MASWSGVLTIMHKQLPFSRSPSSNQFQMGRMTIGSPVIKAFTYGQLSCWRMLAQSDHIPIMIVCAVFVRPASSAKLHNRFGISTPRTYVIILRKFSALHAPTRLWSLALQTRLLFFSCRPTIYLAMRDTFRWRACIRSCEVSRRSCSLRCNRLPRTCVIIICVPTFAYGAHSHRSFDWWAANTHTQTSAHMHCHWPSLNRANYNIYCNRHTHILCLITSLFTLQPFVMDWLGRFNTSRARAWGLGIWFVAFLL